MSRQAPFMQECLPCFVRAPQRQARSGLGGRLVHPPLCTFYRSLPASNFACTKTSVILTVIYLQMLCFLHRWLKILSSWFCGFHAMCPGINCFLFMMLVRKPASVYVCRRAPSREDSQALGIQVTVSLGHLLSRRIWLVVSPVLLSHGPPSFSGLRLGPSRESLLLSLRCSPAV